MKSKIVATLIFVSLSACSMTPHTKVNGLEGMHITRKVVEPGEIWSECQDAANANIFMWPLACARIRFAEHTCVRITATNSTPETIEHEELHCQGFDHDVGMQEAYDAWIAAGGKRTDK